MNKNKEKVPKIRFPGFTEPWEQRKLGDMCDEFKSGSSILAKDICEQGEYPVYGGNGLRGYTATYNHDGIYALIGRQGALCGNMNKVYGKAYFTEHAVAVKANKNNNTDFLFFLLDKMNLRQYSGQSAQPGLAVNKLIELITLVPNCSEQKLIGIFFNKLDNLITLHQRKLNHLKDKKKGLLQKMFPKNGELVPELRFPEFTDPWEQRKLGDVVSYIVDNRGKNPTYYCSEGIPVIDNFMIKNTLYPELGTATRFIDEELYQNFIRKYNEIDDILLTLVGNGIGNISLFPADKAVIIQNTLGLRTDENKRFLFFLLMSKNQEIVKLDRGMAQPSIRQDEILDISIKIPKMEEQEKIGTYFSNLDNLITLHQRKLDHLKEQKKALLQQMFI